MVVEGNVDGALLFAEREVVAAVEAEGEDVRIAGEDAGGAVALVNIEVDHGETSEGGLGAEMGDGDGNIVKDAEAGAFGVKGVVGAAGECAADSILQGRLRSGEGGAGAGECALDELGGGTRKSRCGGWRCGREYRLKKYRRRPDGGDR